MSITAIRGKQVVDGSIQRTDLDTTTVGQAVVARLLQGTNISLSSTGGDAGTGDVTVSAPAVVSSDAGNAAALGSDSRIYVPDRLHGFNAIGNSTFEVDQISAGATVANANAKIIDRWWVQKAGTMVVSAGQQPAASVSDIVVPGTSFQISRSFLRVTLTTAQATLGASDWLAITQFVEGPQWRELAADVHSVSLLVRSSVSGLKFGLELHDPTSSRSLVKLCTIPSAGTWALISLPNLPVWPSSGTFVSTPGSIGYALTLTLAAGTTLTASANDTWQNGNFLGALGQDNFASKTVNSTFDAGFVQHQPGALCTTLIDCPFGQNHDGDTGCLRYYCKSYDYKTAPGAITGNGGVGITQPAGTFPWLYVPFKKTMAKAPTVLGYSTATGAVNNVRNLSTAADIGITGLTQAAGEAGFSGFNLSAAPTALNVLLFHYTADTGL